jgi:hypothetical protein
LWFQHQCQRGMFVSVTVGVRLAWPRHQESRRTSRLCTTCQKLASDATALYRSRASCASSLQRRRACSALRCERVTCTYDLLCSMGACAGCTGPVWSGGHPIGRDHRAWPSISPGLRSSIADSGRWLSDLHPASRGLIRRPAGESCPHPQNPVSACQTPRSLAQHLQLCGCRCLIGDG